MRGPTSLSEWHVPTILLVTLDAKGQADIWMMPATGNAPSRERLDGGSTAPTIILNWAADIAPARR